MLLIIYRLTFVLFLIIFYFILKSGNYTYLLFVAIAYFIRDFIFPVRKVEISQNTLTIIRIYLGGLFDKITMIQRSNIIEVVNAEIGLPDNLYPEMENPSIIPLFFGRGEKLFEIYRIKYLDGRNLEKTMKIALSANEVEALV